MGEKMRKKIISIEHCEEGHVLALDVYNSSGVTLVGRNAPITNYIKNKLIELRIPDVCVYDKIDDNPNDTLKEEYLENISLIKNVLNGLSKGKSIEYKKILDISASLFYGINIGYKTIRILDQVKCIDNYTYGHCINTAFYSMLIGKWLGFDEDAIKKVIQCGILHDIGKCRVPAEILNKRGILTKDEFEIIKKHTILGYSMLDDIRELDAEIRQAVLMHHERIDGSGYPFNVSEDCVNIFARIVAVADVFDAMTSDRVYKKRATPFEAFEMFMTVGIGMFDMSIVNVFLKNIVNYYIGFNVLLSNGKDGKIVFIPPNDILHPIIVSHDRYIDLSLENNLKVISINSGN